MGCSLAELGQKIPGDELPIWLAHFGMKLGYTFDRNEIQKIRTDAFMARARKHWGRN